MTRKNRKYEPEFKIKVIEDKIKNNLGFSETAAKYNLTIMVNGYTYPAESRIRAWERIYLEKGPEGFLIETRGRASVGRPKNAIQLDPSVEEDLIAKCQRLEMENEYLKKLSALVSAREQKEKKSRK